MAESKNRKYHIVIGIVCLIAGAILARVLGNNDIFPATMGLLRAMIYIGLYIGWGFSVYRRILYVPVRRYMIGISFLTVFWFIVRSMKYYFIANLHLDRYLWYGYYIPMLFIPLFCVFISLSIGKQEDFRLPKWIKLLLYIPTIICVLLVLTNDFHQLVFTFPAGEICTGESGTYVYSLGYYLVLGWEIICALTAFVIMLFKCRLAQRKKYLPALVLACSIVYAFIYISGVQWMQMLAGDITAAQCLLFVGILESCIQVGLIPSNTGYVALFEAGTLGSQITDNDYQVRYLSIHSPEVSQEIMREAEKADVHLDKNTLLKSHPIEGGHVLWQEDITDIRVLLEKLEENKKTIAEKNYLDRENYHVKLKINSLREKNRLYDLLQKKTVRQIELLEHLFLQYHAGETDENRRSLLAKIAVIGAYIKRCGNLIFIAEKSETVDMAELALCMEESFANLELMDVDCAVDISGGSRIYTKDAIFVYDFFENVTEAAIDDLHSIWLKARSLADSLVFRLEVECESNLSELEKPGQSCCFEDGIWCFTLKIKKGGE